MAESDPVVLAAGDLLPERGGPVPLYYQLAQGLERAITSNALAPGARLENEVALSDRLGVSRPTVRRAIQELVEKGLLVRRRGVGTQVVHGLVSRQIELTSLFDDLQRSGQAPSTRVLEVGAVAADETVAAQLGVERGTAVTRLRRLRLSDGLPLAILENYLPPSFAQLADEDFNQHSLYALLRDRGVVIRVARQRIGARRLTAAESRLLDVERSAPALTMDRTAYDNSGRAVEYGHHCYRPDLYSFEMTLVDRQAGPAAGL